MVEELMIALAEIVQARFSLGCDGKSVLGAFSVAGKEEFAFLALFGKGALLVLTEGLLAFAIHHFHERLLVQISELEFGEDEMVARIDIAIVLDDQRIATRLAHRADAGG